MELPKSLGVMILPSVNLFPHAILPLFIFEARYRRMLQDALASHRLFCVAMQQPDVDEERPAPVAGVGLIRASVENPDGTSNMILQGVARVALGRVMRRRPYRVHSMKPLAPVPADTDRVGALTRTVRDLVGRRFEQGLPAPLKFLGESAAVAGAEADPAGHILRSLGDIRDASVLADLVSCTLLSDPRQRQVLLETVDVETRLEYLIAFLRGEIDREAGGAAGTPP